MRNAKNNPPPDDLVRLSRDELIEEWRRTDLPERRRAGVEVAIWNTLSKEERAVVVTPGQGMAVYIAKLFNVTAYHVERRQLLYNIGSEADVLWDRIENGSMPGNTAVRIVREAHRRRESIEQTLSRYDALAYESSSGKVHHKKRANRLRTVDEQTNGPSRSVLNTLRDLIATYVDERLENISEIEGDKLRREFELELNMLFDDFSDRLFRARKKAELNELHDITVSKVGRKRVLDACAMLAMDPPKPDRPVDETLLKKRYKSRVRLTHPDVTRREESRQAFEAVVEAYKTLQLYNEGLKEDADVRKEQDDVRSDK